MEKRLPLQDNMMPNTVTHTTAASTQIFDPAASKTIAEIAAIAYPNSIGGIAHLKAAGFAPSAKYHAQPINSPQTGNLTTGITIKKQERPARTATEKSSS